jgi:hypothetical protein
MLNYRKQILLVLILIYSTIGFSQIRFNKTYDFVDVDSSYNNITGTDFIELNDSTFLVHSITGNSKLFDTLDFDKYYVLLNLINKNGDRIDSTKISVKGKQIIGNKIVRTIDGLNFLAGIVLDYKKYLDSNILQDIFFARISDLGDTLWTKKYSFGIDGEYVNEVITTSDGNVIIYGTVCARNNAGCDLYILKLDTNGNVLIKQKYTYTTTSAEYAGGIQINDNNIYLLATSNGDTSGIKAEIFKINRLGQLLSIIRLPHISEFDDEFYSEDLLIDKEGNFVLMASVLRDSSLTEEGQIIKLDTNYNLIWKRRFLSKESNDMKNIIEYNSKYYILGNKLNDQRTAVNQYLICYSKNGNRQFHRLISFAKQNLYSGLLYKLSLTKDKGIAFVGYTLSHDSSFTQYTWFFKTDTLGCFVDGCSFTGIEVKANIQDITLYPNPASEKLFIYGAEGKEIEVIDLNGRSILKTTYDFYGIDLSSLPPAIYTIKINVENQFVFRKFVKY